MPRRVCGHFNPRSPCGERRADESLLPCRGHFNPRSPLRGATEGAKRARVHFEFPRSPRGSDHRRSQRCAGSTIQSALPGKDRLCRTFAGTSSYFQSALPLGSDIDQQASVHIFCIHPRSPCGERLQNQEPVRIAEISIRAPCERQRCGIWKRDVRRFQSALPLRGATQDRLVLNHQSNFNPRSPCGERQRHRVHVRLHPGISIRAPLAGSDRRAMEHYGWSIDISIRAPLAGSDRHTLVIGSAYSLFQSALPLRGATVLLGGGAVGR